MHSCYCNKPNVDQKKKKNLLKAFSEGDSQTCYLWAHIAVASTFCRGCGGWWMESRVCMTPALLETLRSGHLLWQKKGGWHTAFPFSGSLEECARARHWLMMNVSHDWEVKSNCICPQATLFSHHHNYTPTSCSPTGATLHSLVSKCADSKQTKNTIELCCSL